MRGGALPTTSLEFTALDGLVMGTRRERIAPDVPIHLTRRGMETETVETPLCHGSSLKGFSEGRSDMRALPTSHAFGAAQAVAVPLFRPRREIGAMTEVLSGLDGLVFTAGTDRSSPEIRAWAIRGWASSASRSTRRPTRPGPRRPRAGPCPSSGSRPTRRA